MSAPVVLFDDQEAGEGSIHNVALRLRANSIAKTDVYKTAIKFEVEFEVEQK